MSGPLREVRSSILIAKGGKSGVWDKPMLIVSEELAVRLGLEGFVLFGWKDLSQKTEFRLRDSFIIERIQRVETFAFALEFVPKMFICASGNAAKVQIHWVQRESRDRCVWV